MNWNRVAALTRLDTVPPARMNGKGISTVAPKRWRQRLRDFVGLRINHCFAPTDEKAKANVGVSRFMAGHNKYIDEMTYCLCEGITGNHV